MLTPSMLLLSGRCTITEVSEHRDRIATALTSGVEDVLLDLAGVDAADVTFVQLLVAARAEASRRGRAFAVAAWSSVTAETFTRAGFDPAEFSAPAVSGA